MLLLVLLFLQLVLQRSNKHVKPRLFCQQANDDRTQEKAPNSQVLPQEWPQQAGLPRGLERPRANTKSRAHNIDCARKVWGMPPENFESLHSLKCVLEASEAPFHACIQYKHTCKLPPSFSGFRSKITMYGILASSGLHSCHAKKMCIEVSVRAA